MEIESENTDSAVLAELGQRLTHARLARNLKQEDLAQIAGLSKRTVERLEAGHSVQVSNFIRALRALQLMQNLDRLIPDSGPGPGPLAQLKLGQRQRHRASSPRAPIPASGNWTWGNEK